MLHDPSIGYTVTGLAYPVCSCGWNGKVNQDHHQVAMEAYAHAEQAEQAEADPL